MENQAKTYYTAKEDLENLLRETLADLDRIEVTEQVSTVGDKEFHEFSFALIPVDSSISADIVKISRITTTSID